MRKCHVLLGLAVLTTVVRAAAAQTPQLPLNTLNEVSAALRACWVPPPIDQSRAGLQITVQTSFRRNGELFGHLRITFEYAGATGSDPGSGQTVKLLATKRVSGTPAFTPSASMLTANVQFEVHRRTDVLTVPNTALRWTPQNDQLSPAAKAAYANAAATQPSAPGRSRHRG